MRKILTVSALFLLCLTAIDAAPAGKDPIKPMSSFGISGDAAFNTVDDITSLRYGLSFEALAGADILPSWHVYGYAHGTFSADFLSLNRFSGIPFIFSAELGAGAGWRSGRFFLRGEAGISFEDYGGYPMFGLSGRITPGFVLFGLDEDLPIGYALSFPVSAAYNGSGFSMGVSVCISMEIGEDLGLWKRH